MEWTPTAYPVELFTLGGLGTGIPIRASVSTFGPTLLAKVLGLNETQESSLGLVFHYADKQGAVLLDIDRRPPGGRAVPHQRRGQGRPQELGGLSSATAGVILRELITFADQGADVFFGEPEFDTADLLRTAPDGRGLVSMLELPAVQDRPQLFSTFLMWLLADLFHDLPEVGDVDKPKLVFFFDEAHLLFDDASKDFLDAIAADRAPHPVQGRRRLLRDPVAQGRAGRRARPARQPRAARAARLHPRRRQGAQGRREDLPQHRPTTSRSCSPSSAPARPSSRCCPRRVPRRRSRGPGCARPSRSWRPRPRRC